MNDDSRLLVQQASRGDRRAMEELLVRHLPALLAFVRLRAGKLVQAKESCADIVQSVCREVLQDLSRFEYQGESSFKQWLYETALRKIIDKNRFYRAAKRDAAIEVAMPEEPPSAWENDLLQEYCKTFSTPSRNAMTREEIARIENAFQKLPEDYREVILLSRVLGLSHAEIARQMGRTEAAVRNLMHRALVQLSKLLV